MTLQRLSIGTRVVLVGLVIGLVLWLAMDHVQTSSLRQVLLDNAVDQLNTRAHRDRLRLDQRIRSHHAYVTMLAGQATAQPDLLSDIGWPQGTTPRVVDGAPRWLPNRALRRQFAQPDALLVLDESDTVRTLYRLRSVPLPEALTAPDRRLLMQVETEPTLNFFDGQLFLVAAAPFGNGAGRLLGLALVDSEFLRQAQGAFLDDSGVTVLVAGEPPRVLASADPDRAAPGTPLESLRADYLVTGKGFLDYGFSRAQAGFLTLVAQDRVTAVTRPVLALERGQRTIMAAAVGGFFFIVLLLGVFRLRQLTVRVAAFTEQAFGVARPGSSGNELVELETQVQLLTSEVLSSRAALEAEASERLRLLSEANARLEAEVQARTADLRAALAEAQQANLAKNRFLASASHDLRQPLQAIRLFEAVLRGQLTGTPAEPAVNRLGESVATAEVLLSALLEVSKLDAGIIMVHPVDFNVGAMLHEVAEEYGAQAEDVGSELRVVDCGAIINADRKLVGRIVRNLVANAIRHARGSRIVLGARRLAGGVRIEVCDRGPGIDPAEQTLIFEEFYQLGNPERDRNKGLGLGLSIARKLADLCHLPLTVRSVPGRGSTFALTLPYRATSTAALVELEAARA
jgi:signal transduction histidine kinase